MRIRTPEHNSVIVACCRDLAELQNLQKTLTAAGVSVTVREEGITDDDPATGYPRAYDIFWTAVEPSQSANASVIAKSKHTPASGKLVCPNCLSTSIEIEGFIRCACVFDEMLERTSKPARP
jgi:hypothetical protein